MQRDTRSYHNPDIFDPTWFQLGDKPELDAVLRDAVVLTTTIVQPISTQFDRALPSLYIQAGMYR